MNMTAIGYTRNILPTLWKFLENCENCSISVNIATIDGEVVISILNKNRIKRFTTKNKEIIKKLQTYLRVY